MQMQMWQYIGGADMLYKKVVGFEDYEVIEPVIRDINIINFQDEVVNECIDVPFKLVGNDMQDSKHDCNQDKEKFEISDNFVTGFAIFTLIVGAVLCAISWLC